MKTLVSLVLFFFASSLLQAQQKGIVYIVYGSDTGIWAGMDVGNRNPTYDLGLFTSPSGNAARIMSSEFRSRIRDSNGRPLVMTWWMMCGNIFRDATNSNVPYPNLMTMRLMKTYYDSAIVGWGDELSLHYHTFTWTDYNGDGLWYWNQATLFNECREDFDFTLAQLLVEEEEFPVSFRSGWHAMDNDWQNRLDDLLPFSMHNDYPHKRSTITEPIDNVYDWSISPSSWVPFHPSTTDYRIPGSGRGWNLRSISLGSVTRATVEGAFQEAAAGHDQILCLWSHLPDNAIFDDLIKVDTVLHGLAAAYPGVAFNYVTAVEGMQKFLHDADTTRPDIQVALEGSASLTTLAITTDEPLFAGHPFVALKTKAEDYRILAVDSVGPNQWKTSASFDANEAARVGITATDTSGNLAMWFHSFVPADLFLDDQSSSYTETRGSWTTIPSATWGLTSRQAAVSQGDSAGAVWSATITQAGTYAALIQLPQVTGRCNQIRLRVRLNGALQFDSLSTTFPANQWIDLGRFACLGGDNLSIELAGFASAASAQVLGADVVRITPLVPTYKVTPEVAEVSLGFRSLNDSVYFSIPLKNRGLSDASVTSVLGTNSISTEVLPKTIEAGRTTSIACMAVLRTMGVWSDTVTIEFGQPELSTLRIPLRGLVEKVVRIVDNDDAIGYLESGSWYTSNVVAYGSSSRYCYLLPLGQYAQYDFRVPESGFYTLSFLVPSSENASDRALYLIREGTLTVDSVFCSQLPGGNWASVGTYRLTADSLIRVKVMNVGGQTSGQVLRADAMKLSAAEITPTNEYVLDNDSLVIYQETGTWHTSNAQAVGPSSRYANLSEGPGQTAVFRFQVWEPGSYSVSFIVPTTANASDNALYRIWVNGVLVDSLRKNQNAGSGSWVQLGVYSLPSNRTVSVEVINDGQWTQGTVLRADAIRLLRVATDVAGGSGAIPLEFSFDPMFPNPFNSSTTIQFQLPAEADVRIAVHDILGREIKRLLDSRLTAGPHSVRWDATTNHGSPAASGIYFVRLDAGKLSSVRRVLLLK